jgi:HD-GYP domain-containing protein (c-di-GMP phosphodiesterase class II)
MVLGESLFLRSQELLLSAGFRLKQEQIISLKKRGFSSVLINVEGTEDVIPETVISTHLHQEMALCLSKMETDFVDAFTVQAEGIQAIEKFIAENKHKLSKFLTTSQIGPKVEEFIQEILSKPVTILNMVELLKAESGLFYHAMNVAVLSLCIGKKFRFSTEEMKQLGIGAIHYDLGMVAVPRQILAKKRDDLIEDETAMLQQHTVFGYLMLSQNSLFAPTSAAVAYQHHERQDGSGKGPFA